MAAADGWALLVDAPRGVVERLDGARALAGLVLTHGHRDASDGVVELRDLVGDPPLPVFASTATFAAVRGRHRPADLDHLELRDVDPGGRRRRGPWSLRATEVPHADSPRFPTYAWRLTARGRSLVYASDVAELTPRLRRAVRGADLLVLDGAMYRRSIFSHLRIEEAVPEVCDWNVQRILLTQIGRSAPRHEELETIVADLCDQAAPAYDGMELRL
ncbi:MAG: MBL fold metallo-hydrolase [Nitriliruptorales bacterium]|nr:MBL fold metallo-hydrolase [Nitriliruptorales bacterium]